MMPENELNYDEIRERHLDMLITLALRWQDSAELSESEREQNAFAADPDPARRAFDRAMARWEQERETARQTEAGRRKTRRQHKRVRLSRLINIVCCLILVTGICAPVAIANIEPLRTGALKLIAGWEGDRTVILVAEDPDYVPSVPEEYTGSYFPAYMPEGFGLYEIVDLYPGGFARYADREDENRYFCFDEITDASGTSVNTKAAYLSRTEINGSAALVIDQGINDHILWSVQDRGFILTGHNMNVEELLRIAGSVRRIPAECR